MSSGDAFRRHPWEPSQWALMSRGACSECHGSIVWMPARDLAFEVAPGDRLRVFELIDFVGSDAAAWYCDGCRAWGVFDGVHQG